MSVEILEHQPAEDAQRRVAGALEAQGFVAGDRIAFCMPTSASLLVSVVGALRSAVVPVMLNSQLLPKEREALLFDCDPRMVIQDEESLAALLRGRPIDLAPYPLARPMHYTSGTTGRPKGVWSGILSEELGKALFEDETEVWGFDEADTHLVCSPMHHSVSIRFAAGTLLSGGKVAILSRFDAAEAISVIEELRPSTTFMAPTALQRVVRNLAAPEKFESLRLLVHAGSPCSVTLKHEALAKVADGVLWEFYGSTEGQFTVCSPQEWLDRPLTVGRARPGRSLSVDGSGVVWCQAPQFARFEYFRDPAATAKAWRDDSFTVGDLGRLDDDGYLFLEGRREDLIITGGVNVYPAELEVILSHAPGVAEVAVFGVDDEEWGQKVCVAFCGATGEDALRAHASQTLAPYKRPKLYVRVDELPRTSTGKLLRRELRMLVAER